MRRNIGPRLVAVIVLHALLLSGCDDDVSTTPPIPPTPPPATTYSVGGSVSGLAGGTTVVLQNSGGNTTSISANGGFRFSAQLPGNSHYAVTMLTQPTGRTCTVNAGGGTINGSNVTSVQVACTTATYMISGTLSGLTSGAQVTVQNNGGMSITLKANGSFTFPTPISYNGSYAVTVPVQPPALTCIVGAGSGPHITANVSVSVACTAATEKVLYSFLGGTADGNAPLAALIQGSDGNFYGTTTNGGAASSGTVFRF